MDETKQAEMTEEQAKSIVKKEIVRRAKKRAAFKKWRKENKEKYNAYYKGWRERKKLELKEAIALLEASKQK